MFGKIRYPVRQWRVRQPPSSWNPSGDPRQDLVDCVLSASATNDIISNPMRLARQILRHMFAFVLILTLHWPRTLCPSCDSEDGSGSMCVAHSGRFCSSKLRTVNSWWMNIEKNRDYIIVLTLFTLLRPLCLTRISIRCLLQDYSTVNIQCATIPVNHLYVEHIQG